MFRIGSWVRSLVRKRSFLFKEDTFTNQFVKLFCYQLVYVAVNTLFMFLLHVWPQIVNQFKTLEMFLLHPAVDSSNSHKQSAKHTTICCTQEQEKQHNIKLTRKYCPDSSHRPRTLYIFARALHPFGHVARVSPGQLNTKQS